LRDKVRGAYADTSAIYYPSQASSPYFVWPFIQAIGLS